MLVFYFSNLTLHEILELLEENPQHVEIVLSPPLDATLYNTDEDSADEENPSINNLSRSQLNALVEVAADNYEEPEEPLRKLPKKRSSTKATANLRQWKEKKELITETQWPLFSGAAPPLLSPSEYFYRFFDEQVVGLITTFTNKYATQNNRPGDIEIEEIYAYIGILLLSGYSSVSRYRMYWEKSEDSNNNLVSKAMTRDRFKFITTNLHVCDNNFLDVNDKFTKLRPLISILNDRFMDYLPIEENHSIDESMVPYFGRHGTKQFLKGKPIRFGFKFWCGGLSSGYISWFEPYQGSGTRIHNFESQGLGYGVVMTYAKKLKGNFPYKLYFDNFFTTLSLLEDLRNNGIYASGTMRENRLGKDFPLESTCMKKKSRGSMQYCTTIDDGLSVVMWMDNNIVIMATNFDKINPVHRVSRFSKKERTRILINQPHMVNHYNHNMGGIDRADQNVSLYRVSIKGKKWYFPIFCYMVDLSMHNAWQLYRKDGGTLDQLEFRRRVSKQILEKYPDKSRKGRPSKSDHIDSRYDGMHHYIKWNDESQTLGRKTQLICRHCGKKTTTSCKKCNIPLHIECFQNFHIK